jgi:hypothetical protein
VVRILSPASTCPTFIGNSFSTGKAQFTCGKVKKARFSHLWSYVNSGGMLESTLRMDFLSLCAVIDGQLIAPSFLGIWLRCAIYTGYF